MHIAIHLQFRVAHDIFLAKLLEELKLIKVNMASVFSSTNSGCRLLEVIRQGKLWICKFNRIINYEVSFSLLLQYLFVQQKRLTRVCAHCSRTI